MRIERITVIRLGVEVSSVMGREVYCLRSWPRSQLVVEYTRPVSAMK